MSGAGGMSGVGSVSGVGGVSGEGGASGELGAAVEVTTPGVATCELPADGRKALPAERDDSSRWVALAQRKEITPWDHNGARSRSKGNSPAAELVSPSTPSANRVAAS